MDDITAWQVIRHDVTSGRDSGYPTEVKVGPLFADKTDAQAEANQLLDKIPFAQRTRNVLDKSESGRYLTTWTNCPTYEVRSVAVLSRVGAAERRLATQKVRKDLQLLRAAKLRAEADALEADSR